MIPTIKDIKNHLKADFKDNHEKREMTVYNNSNN